MNNGECNNHTHHILSKGILFSSWNYFPVWGDFPFVRVSYPGFGSVEELGFPLSPIVGVICSFPSSSLILRIRGIGDVQFLKLLILLLHRSLDKFNSRMRLGVILGWNGYG